MNQPDSFHFSLEDNVELKKLLAGVRVGEKRTFEVTFQFDQIDDKIASGSIDEVALTETSEPDIDDDVEVASVTASPVMSVMMKGKGRTPVALP